CAFFSSCPLNALELMTIEKPTPGNYGSKVFKENPMGLLSAKMNALSAQATVSPTAPATPTTPAPATPTPTPGPSGVQPTGFCPDCGEARTFANTIQNGSTFTHAKCSKAQAQTQAPAPIPSGVRMFDQGAEYALPGGRNGRLEEIQGQNGVFYLSAS